MITQVPCENFIHQLWVPPDRPDVRAQSQYLIRDLSDALLLWTTPSPYTGTMSYVGVRFASVVAVQNHPVEFAETTQLLWSVIGSSAARVRYRGTYGDVVFDSMDELRARLAWSSDRLRYWHTAERLKVEAAWAQTRLDRLVWCEEKRDPLLAASVFFQPDDEEGC